MRAITKAAKSAAMGDCIAMSPEGTRSKSGQLLAFKKGPFYLWQQLQTPVVPMVTYGAFELYPPGKKISNCGKVYVRFLTPVQPHEANSRDEMSRLVRRRMLESIRAGPKDAGDPLTWPQRLENVAYLLAHFTACFLLWRFSPFRYAMVRYSLTAWQLLLVVLLGSMGITLVFYVHLMYVVHWVDALAVAAGWASSAEEESEQEKASVSTSGAGSGQKVGSRMKKE